jgi:phosphoribosylaminoimidazole-succinocarboxamide synthase
MSAENKPSPPMHESQVAGLARLHQGKVRDIYAVDDGHMLIVTTDRLSAFDVVLPDPIPGKGRVLTQISNYWFALTRHIVPNHLSDYPLSRAVPDDAARALLADRSMIVRRLTALPVEAVVRGYLIGSGWKGLPAHRRGLRHRPSAGSRARRPAPHADLHTSTKAERGQHDENVGFAHIEALIGAERAAEVRDAAVALYAFAAELALRRGIIADTKFEFGVDDAGTLTLIDEALTPDSSRFWPVDTYRPGTSPPSFDKQFVRDYLETLDWDKRPPAPHTCRRRHPPHQRGSTRRRCVG